MESVILTDLEGRNVKAELLSQEGEQQLLRLEDGQTLSLPKDALVKQHSGDYYLLLKLSELEASAGGAATSETAETEETIIPLAEERIVVSKRRVDGATVRVTKQVHEEEQTVDEMLLSEKVEVERVRIDKVVEAPEPIRYEDAVTIIPLYEEVLVIEKRLMLTEEVRVSKRRSEKREPKSVTVRRESASVERIEPEKGVMEG